MRKGFYERMMTVPFLCLLGLLVVLPCAALADVPDMSLTVEAAQAATVVAQFADASTQGVDQAALVNMAAAYLPEGAQCSGVLVTDYAVYFDYRLNDTLYWTCYIRDGSVDKRAREIDSDVFYSVSSKDQIVRQENVNDLYQRVTYTRREWPWWAGCLLTLAIMLVAHFCFFRVKK